MDKVLLLCEKDREMMEEFSRRSIKAVHANSLLALTLSFSSRYLDGNVSKEVAKDRLIIEEAARAWTAGRPVCDLDLEEMFEKTKTVDKAFLAGLSIPSFAISVHYSDFADIRIQRIWRIARTVYALLKNWPDGATFSDAVKSAFSQDEFREILLEILHLYNQETRMLGDSIRSPFHSEIRSYVETLFKAMESTMIELADRYTKTIYGDKLVHAENRPDPAPSTECL